MKLYFAADEQQPSINISRVRESYFRGISLQWYDFWYAMSINT
ncbi:hypothetical protein HBA_0813 [Sodalis endosymbiont of Henestaris halophilus]|nr:hypothetical protein HBA_0813 [Sodalis endosymbiont of Henestaris halophilus]